jgi:hypothetical protein
LTSANIAPVKLAWDHQTALIIPNGAHYGQSTSGLLVIQAQSKGLPFGCEVGHFGAPTM